MRPRNRPPSYCWIIVRVVGVGLHLPLCFANEKGRTGTDQEHMAEDGDRFRHPSWIVSKHVARKSWTETQLWLS